MKFLINLPKKTLIFLIKIYQSIVSPIINKNPVFLSAPGCRFYPTCSSYSVDAIKKYGAIMGVFLSLKRIARCHPFSEGGADNLK